MGELSRVEFPSRNGVVALTHVPASLQVRKARQLWLFFVTLEDQLCSQQLGYVAAAFRALHGHCLDSSYVISLQVCLPLCFPWFSLTSVAAAFESIPAALLSRARNIAAEHKTLTAKLADGFDTKSAKKLGEYGPIVSALEKWDKANEVRGMSTRVACGR